MVNYIGIQTDLSAIAKGMYELHVVRCIPYSGLSGRLVAKVPYTAAGACNYKHTYILA